jgi:predicted Fe-Mo cluster-binding NifX family protein
LKDHANQFNELNQVNDLNEFNQPTEYPPMRVAVASKSGIEVDQHFGHAERFLIYETGKGTIARVGEVQVEKYCSFDPDNPMRHRQFDGIVVALEGCRVVVTAMIGEYPRQELEKAGLVHVVAAGPIDEALRRALQLHPECACGK